MQMKKFIRQTQQAQRGVGLLEVLAALFVLSVGLLGIAGLQAQGVRAGHSATLRTIAVLQAQEIIERMRTNPLGVKKDDVTQYNSTADDLGVNNSCGKVSGAPPEECDPGEMAKYDIYVWKSNLLSAFPNMTPTATIGVEIGAPSNVTVTVNWVERGDAKSYTTLAQL